MNGISGPKKRFRALYINEQVFVAKLDSWISPKSSNMIKRLKILADHFDVNRLESIKVKRKLKKSSDYGNYFAVFSENRSANKIQKHFRAINRINLPPTVSLTNSFARDKMKKAKLFLKLFKNVFISITDPFLRIQSQLLLSPVFQLKEVGERIILKTWMYLKPQDQIRYQQPSIKKLVVASPIQCIKYSTKCSKMLFFLALGSKFE